MDSSCKGSFTTVDGMKVGMKDADYVAKCSTCGGIHPVDWNVDEHHWYMKDHKSSN